MSALHQESEVFSVVCVEVVTFMPTHALNAGEGLSQLIGYK